ncbi:MAG: sulfatase-like hydrolase/transferase [Candidatus Binatia bacterium]|nr:sulfatase-like hydrolase/transferase [Candidatus Binatia bacterium]
MAVYALAPAFATALLQHQSGWGLFIAATDYVVTFSLGVTFLLATSRLGRAAGLASGTVCVVAGLYGTILWGLIVYWIWSGHQLDVRFALDAESDVVRTLKTSLRWRLPLLLAMAAGCAGILWQFWRQGSRWLRRNPLQFFRSWTIVVPLGLQVLLWSLCAHEQRMVWPELAAVLARAADEPIVAPLFPETSDWDVVGGESVYLLQLESGSAHALSGTLKFEGRRYDGDYMPNLRRVARDGVFFPFFWSNSVQSNRALENILCGITNNVGQALSYNPGKILSECLPSVLRRAGYRTLFYVAFDDPNFMNYRNFARALGFDEFRDGPSLGFVSDLSSWGIDDCRFYDAVFDDLERRGQDEKQFVYIEVSAHHYPFAGRAGYAHLHPFPLPQNPVEWYLNSWVEQDHCVAHFYARYQKLTQGDAHLIITPDHSWPVGMHGNHLNDYGWFAENFAIPFVYVPPRARAAEFRVGEVVGVQPSLADLPPTVLELLDGRRRAHSFAWLLKRSSADAAVESAELCHILVQPYSGGQIVIQRPGEKFVYHLKRQRLERYDLVADPEERSPEVVAERMSYPEFRQSYFCERYRTAARR